jgi:septum formation protein
VTAPPPLVLASRSPQRRAILQRLGVAFELRPTDVPERDRGAPHQVALDNALAKARAAAARGAGGAEAVLGVDTLVCRDGEIFGKPADERHARATLAALSGGTHEVISGVAVALPDRTLTATAVTEVCFRTLESALLDWYVGTGEWRGRAGGYAIQGAGAALVRALRGDYENVVGLPLAALLDLYPPLLQTAVAGAAGTSRRPV